MSMIGSVTYIEGADKSGRFAHFEIADHTRDETTCEFCGTTHHGAPCAREDVKFCDRNPDSLANAVRE